VLGGSTPTSLKYVPWQNVEESKSARTKGTVVLWLKGGVMTPASSRERDEVCAWQLYDTLLTS